jgi:DNA invertase Pin-like site-specific DNA recombinase
MARKSRKNIETTTPAELRQTKIRLGGYVRLSAVDRKQKGDSIENQQSIIRAYIAEHPELELAEMYIDNGVTGQTFDRPAFQRMLVDLEDSKIVGCVSKDLSRLGRNSIDTGYYIEKFFPTNGYRYIAINDNYDSADGQSGGIMVSLKNMVNEAYALDVGRKVRAAKQMNIRNGKFIGRIPPYGYMKSPEDKYLLIPDPVTAPIVRTMYEKVANGTSVLEVLAWLLENSVLPPRKYLYTIGLTTEKEASGHPNWTLAVIYQVLKNRIYVGDMVQGKTHTYSYDITAVPKSEWIIAENTHEPLVSRELFDKVQSGWGYSSHKTRVPYPQNIFARKVFCGHCGYSMCRAKSRNGTMQTYCGTRQTHGKDACVQVSIHNAVLKETVFEMLRAQAAVFADKHNFAPAMPTTDNTELRNVQTEFDRNSRFLKGLYESLVEGDITNDEYKEMKSAYESRIADLTKQEQNLREAARLAALETEKRGKAADSYGVLRSADDLTAEVVDKLIDKILVFHDKHIEVTFKFIDETVTAGGLGNE